MTRDNPFLSKVTKIFVAAVVLASVSFGAFGLGRALNPAAKVKQPKNAYYAAYDSWQDIPYFIDRLAPDTGADWDNLVTMVSLRLPQGEYMVTSGALLYNGDDIGHRIQCWITTSADAYTGQFMAPSMNLAATFDEEAFSQTVPVTVTGQFARVFLKCGSFEEVVATAPQMNKAYVSAIWVSSLSSKTVN